MNFSVCTIALRKRAVFEMLDIVKQDGYAHVDIFHEHLSHKTPPADVERIAAAAAERGIAIGARNAGKSIRRVRPIHQILSGE